MRHLTKPTLFKCEQTQMGLRNTVQTWDSMDDTPQTLKPWVIFAGCVLVIVVLYWAQAVLVPIALAVLLTFVLTPPVSWLERWLGRGLVEIPRIPLPGASSEAA